MNIQVINKISNENNFAVSFFDKNVNTDRLRDVFSKEEMDVVDLFLDKRSLYLERPTIFSCLQVGRLCFLVRGIRINGI